jgi:hypothetical protein
MGKMRFVFMGGGATPGCKLTGMQVTSPCQIHVPSQAQDVWQAFADAFPEANLDSFVLANTPLNGMVFCIQSASENSPLTVDLSTLWDLYKAIPSKNRRDYLTEAIPKLNEYSKAVLETLLPADLRPTLNNVSDASKPAVVDLLNGIGRVCKRVFDVLEQFTSHTTVTACDKSPVTCTLFTAGRQVD